MAGGSSAASLSPVRQTLPLSKANLGMMELPKLATVNKDLQATPANPVSFKVCSSTTYSSVRNKRRPWPLVTYILRKYLKILI